MPAQETPLLWQALRWEKGALSETRAVNQPLHVEEAPQGPGLYRMIWKDSVSWKDARKERMAKATPLIGDARLDFSNLSPPISLTIGRSTNLYTRIRQHFGTNPNNNRLFTRLQELFPTLAPADLRRVAKTSIEVSWVSVEAWTERCVLELYGCATERPIFDIDAEH